MPDGSSSAAPVIRPGPRTRKKRRKISSFLFAAFFCRRPPPAPPPVDPFMALASALFFHETLGPLWTVPSQSREFLAAHSGIRDKEILDFFEQVWVEIAD